MGRGVGLGSYSGLQLIDDVLALQPVMVAHMTLNRVVGFVEVPLARVEPCATIPLYDYTRTVSMTLSIRARAFSKSPMSPFVQNRHSGFRRDPGIPYI